MGPTASPSTKRLNASMAAVREISKYSAISGVAGVMSDEPQVTEKPRQAVAAVWYDFLSRLLFQDRSHVSIRGAL